MRPSVHICFSPSYGSLKTAMTLYSVLTCSLFSQVWLYKLAILIKSEKVKFLPECTQHRTCECILSLGGLV